MMVAQHCLSVQIQFLIVGSASLLQPIPLSAIKISEYYRFLRPQCALKGLGHQGRKDPGQILL